MLFNSWEFQARWAMLDDESWMLDARNGAAPTLLSAR